MDFNDTHAVRHVKSSSICEHVPRRLFGTSQLAVPLPYPSDSDKAYGLNLFKPRTPLGRSSPDPKVTERKQFAIIIPFSLLRIGTLEENFVRCKVYASLR